MEIGVVLTIRLFEFAAYLEILVMYREGRSQLHTGNLQVKLGDLVGLFIWNIKTEHIPNVTSKFLPQVRTRLLNMTWSNLRLNFEGLLLPWQQIYHLAFEFNF